MIPSVEPRPERREVLNLSPAQWAAMRKAISTSAPLLSAGLLAFLNRRAWGRPAGERDRTTRLLLHGPLWPFKGLYRARFDFPFGAEGDGPMTCRTQAPPGFRYHRPSVALDAVAMLRTAMRKADCLLTCEEHLSFGTFHDPA